MHQSYFEQSLYLNDPLLTYLGTYLTLASVKLLLFEQPDSDLDSLLHKTDERDSPFQELRQNLTIRLFCSKIATI